MISIKLISLFHQKKYLFRHCLKLSLKTRLIFLNLTTFLCNQKPKFNRIFQQAGQTLAIIKLSLKHRQQKAGLPSKLQLLLNLYKFQLSLLQQRLLLSLNKFKSSNKILIHLLIYLQNKRSLNCINLQIHLCKVKLPICHIQDLSNNTQEAWEHQ